MRKKIVLLMFLISIIATAFDKKSNFTQLQDTGLSNKISGPNKILKTTFFDTYSVVFSPDGKFLANGGGGGESCNFIAIWDTATGKRITNLTDTGYRVYSLAYSPDGKFLASGGDYLKIWDTTTGKNIQTLSKQSNINSVTYSPDGKLLVNNGGDNKIEIWDTTTYKRITILNGNNSQSIAFSPNGKFIASGGWENTIKIWDISSGKLIKTINNFDKNIFNVAYSPDGKFLASCSDEDDNIRIWDSVTGECIQTFKDDNNKVRSIAYSPNGKFLANSNNDNTIKIWDISSGKCIDKLDSNFYVYNLAYSLDGKSLAFTGEGIIEIWNNIETYKSRVKNNGYIKNDNQEIIGTVPQGMVVDVSLETKEIYKPLSGFINPKDFELLYSNNTNTKLYTLVTIPVYIDINKTKTIGNIEKGTILNQLYYSVDLDMYYIESKTLKGWIEPINIGLLEKEVNKIAILANNTNSYEGNKIKNIYKSGDVLESNYIEKDNKYYYSDSFGWIPQSSAKTINESEKIEKVFVNEKEVKFNFDFTGDNFKSSFIGTEYNLLGDIGEYYWVQSKDTDEKGWILKTEMSLKRPDLNDTLILLNNLIIGENNILEINGKVYDDTQIDSLLINNIKIPIKSLKNFDKISYIPEVGYSFTFKYPLMFGIDNEIEIKVIMKDEKTYTKILKYNSELKPLNLDEFTLKK